MTADEQYVPSEDEMRHAYWLTRMLDHHAAVDAAFDRFLDRVRRDAEAELDSWMARAYEAEGKLWQAEVRLSAWMEHWNTTARTGAVDEVAAILEANARADQAEARIKAVRELHVPDRPLDKYPDCAECTIHGYCEDDAPVEWPCPTIRALDGA